MTIELAAPASTKHAVEDHEFSSLIGAIQNHNPDKALIQ